MKNNFENLNHEIISSVFNYLKSSNLQDSGIHTITITLKFYTQEKINTDNYEIIKLSSIVLINPENQSFFLEGLKGLMFLLPKKIKGLCIDLS